MDVPTIDQAYAQLQAQDQTIVQELQTLAGKLQTAAQGGNADAREWQLDLRELALAVAQANQRNGAVVAALIRNTRGALDILRSIPAGESAAVYGPRGQTLGAGKAKPLGSA
jgi:flagellar biosynthesis/type III secretory pathway chaperone